jgi:hypothetical protein
VSRYTLKAVLNHALSDSDDVTAGYVQVNDAMKLNALQKIEAYVFATRPSCGCVIFSTPFPGRPHESDRQLLETTDTRIRDGLTAATNFGDFVVYHT